MISSDFVINNSEKQNFRELFERYPIPTHRRRKDLLTFYGDVTKSFLNDLKAIVASDEVIRFVSVAAEWFEELSFDIYQMLKHLISGKKNLAYDLLRTKIANI